MKITKVDAAEFIEGSCLEILPQLEAESFQVCITSPPFYGLRLYGSQKWQGGDPACEHVADNAHQKLGATSLRKGRSNVESQRNDNFSFVCGKCGAVNVNKEIGREQTLTEYIANIVAVGREVRRVLRADGVWFLNLGDSYATDPRKGASGDGKNAKQLGGREQTKANRKPLSGFKQKDMMMVPHRTAIALQDDGWYVRSCLSWIKRNSMPTSADDRPGTSTEYFFMLTKSADYCFDMEAVKLRAS